MNKILRISVIGLGVWLFFLSGLLLANEVKAPEIESPVLSVTATPTKQESSEQGMKNLSYECKGGEKKFYTKTLFYDVWKDPTHDPAVWGYSKESFNVLRSEISIQNQILPVSMKAFVGNTLLASGEEISIGDGILKSISDVEGAKRAKSIIAEAKKKDVVGQFYEFPITVELTSGTCKTNISVLLKAPKDLVDKTDQNFLAIAEKEKKIAEEVKVCERELAEKKFKQTLVHTNYCIIEKCSHFGSSFGMDRLRQVLEGIKKSIKTESAKNGLIASCPHSVGSSVRAQAYMISSLLGVASCAGGMTNENMTPTDCSIVALHAFADRAMRSSLLKDQDLSEMAKFAGRKIYEKKTQVEQPKEKKPEELDPDEIVTKMAQEKNAEPPVKEEIPADKNWVIVVQ